MQKGFVVAYLLFGVLVLAALGGAYFFGKSQVAKPQTQNQVVSQAPQPVISTKPTSPSNETANWKTYTNNKYNFSFKYPADLEIEQDGDKWASFAIRKNENDREIVNRFGVDGDMTIDDFEKIYSTQDNQEIIGGIAGWGQKAIKIKNLVIDGEKATQYKTVSTINVNPDPESFPTFLTVVRRNKNVVKILYHSGLETNNYMNDYNQILSTFKFLDKEGQNVGMGDWLTYENTKYNYSFKYPKLFFISSGGFGKLEEEVAKKLDEVNLIEKSLFANGSNRVYIKVAVTNNNTCISDIECAQAMKKKIGVLNYKQKLITIDGQEIHGFEYQTKDSDEKTYNGSHEYFIFPRNGKIWNIYFYYSLTDLSEKEIRDFYSAFEKIMTSFSIQ